MISILYVTFLCLLMLKQQFVLGNKWIYVEKTDSSYFVKTGPPKMNFTEAEAHCVSIGGHLTSIHSETENIYVENLVNSFVVASERKTWWFMPLIGLHRNAVKKDLWQNTDGTPVDYTSWANDEPNNLAEGCVVIIGTKSKYIVWGYKKYEWNDHPCHFEYETHVCKKQGTDGSKVIANNLNKITTIEETFTSTTTFKTVEDTSGFEVTLAILAGLLLIIILLLLLLLRCLYKKCSRKKYNSIQYNGVSTNVNGQLTEDNAI